MFSGFMANAWIIGSIVAIASVKPSTPLMPTCSAKMLLNGARTSAPLNASMKEAKGT